VALSSRAAQAFKVKGRGQQHDPDPDRIGGAATSLHTANWKHAADRHRGRGDELAEFRRGTRPFTGTSANPG